MSEDKYWYADFQYNGWLMTSERLILENAKTMDGKDVPFAEVCDYEPGDKLKAQWDAGNAGKKMRVYVCREKKTNEAVT